MLVGADSWLCTPVKCGHGFRVRVSNLQATLFGGVDSSRVPARKNKNQKEAEEWRVTGDATTDAIFNVYYDSSEGEVGAVLGNLKRKNDLCERQHGVLMMERCERESQSNLTFFSLRM